MHKSQLTLLTIILLVLLTTCGKPVKLVLGEWLWVETTGGLQPPRTSESTGTRASLTITRDQWSYFENGQEVERYQIDIKRRSKGLIITSDLSDNDKLVEFINDDEISITYYGGPNSDCQDSNISRFSRIRD